MMSREREPPLQAAVRTWSRRSRRSPSPSSAARSRPSSMPSRSLAYRTSTDQAAPNVTLNAKIVMNSVRIGGWSTSQRMPSAMSGAEAASPSRWRGSTSCCVSATRVTSTAPSAKQAAFVANGSAMPIDEQERADRRRDELVHEQERRPGAARSRCPRSSRGTSRGSRLLLADVGERLRGAQHEQRGEDEGDVDGAADDRRREHGEDDAPGARLTTTTIRRRSTRSATTPADDAEQQHRQVSGPGPPARRGTGRASARRPAAARRRARRRRRCC